MNIFIKTIPHKKQRYRTAGDWFFDKFGDLYIRVSFLGNWRYEFLVALHEMIEVAICKSEGISQREVDAFDIAFEKERDKNMHNDSDEPGDDPRSPYKDAHQFAGKIEKMTSNILGVVWDKYGDSVEAL